jgi:hypothetical protein
MAKYDGTRFTKAAIPQAGGALNVSSRIIGANPRKQKLTEAAGTNPSKMGGGAITAGKKSSYAQDTAPHKSLDYDFSVGGPGGSGFDAFKVKGFK